MKKILLIAILLAASNCVSATTNFYLTDSSGNDEIGLYVGLPAELLFWYTGDPINRFDVEIDVGLFCPGTILGGEITATGRNPMFDEIYMPGVLYGYDIELAGFADTGSLGSGLSNPLAKINFLLENIGDVTLDLYNVYTIGYPGGNEIIPVCHGAIVFQIPEPASAAILAVGLLFTAYKKKKH